MTDESGDGLFACFNDEHGMMVACEDLLDVDAPAISVIQTNVAIGVSLGFMLIAIILVRRTTLVPFQT